MGKKSIQDILPLIAQPSRYLGSEINAVKKDESRVKLKLALVFPDLYEIGTSHFGLQILYHVLNSYPEIAAERVFSPATDMEAYLRSSSISIASMESGNALNRFDIVGFSLLYELNYTNILNLLELAGIPFLSEQRDHTYPLIISGGPCTCNPEPVADFFDAMVVGDGEDAILKMSRVWLEWRKNGKEDKKSLLKKWSKIEGVYIPVFFKPKFDSSGFQTLDPKFSDYQTIKRTIIENLDAAPFPDTPIVPYGKPVHDRLRLEVSRGCTRGCRFCQAGMIYRPVRERSPETLLSLSDLSVASTGYEDISLLSLSTGDYSCIIPLMERLTARYASQKIAVSFPSLRVGTLPPKLMNLIKKIRKTGFTIAPEAGSQRLRNIINKNITEEDIIITVKDAFRLGWKVIKLYFMVGLPTETDEDIQAIVDLVKKLRNIKLVKGCKGRINVSVATFIPKPHTPFQWSSQIPLEEAKQKIERLKRELKMSGIHLKWQNPEVSIIEGLWARGDRRLNRLLITAHKKGCKFDGWSDHFKYRRWQEAFRDEGIDIDFFTTRGRNLNEPLPWDHIDTMVSRDFLIREWDKAKKGEDTADCRTGDCNNCGVCDFDKIKPMVYDNDKEDMTNHISSDHHDNVIYRKLKVSFSKLNQAKYFGHLELVRIFTRAMRRAGISLKFSEGFHPKPVISFEDPLPIGLESLNETFYISVNGNIKPQTVINRLNRHLPDGLRILYCQLAPTKRSGNPIVSSTYLITKETGLFNSKDLVSFMKDAEYIIPRTNRKGKTKWIDLKEMVLNITLPLPDRIKMTLRSEPGKTIRPFEVMENIFGMTPEEIRQASIIKLGSSTES